MDSKYLRLVFILMLFSQYSFSQTEEDQREKNFEEVIESIAESDESDIDNSSVLEDFTKNAERPVNINVASYEQMDQLGIMDFRQIQNVIVYRRQNGYLVSIYELSAIEGFTPDLITALSPFLSFVMPSDSADNSQKVFYQHLITRVKTTFPLAAGYSSVSESKGAVYPGLPISIYNRYNFEIPDKMMFGLVADHDAGEAFFKKSNKLGFDHYSGYLSWKGKKWLRQVTIGDFLLRFGQGVNFGAGSGLGKSGNVLGIMKPGQGIRPCTSTDENRFFRGISTTFGSGPMRLMFFYSQKNRDANIVTDPETGNRYFTSIQTSGYHRTLSEIADERSVNEQIAGGYAELRFRKLKIGIMFVNQQFNLPMSNGTSPYKAKSFSGSQNYNLGADYQLALRNIQFFGETGLSKNLKPGVVQGMVWHPHPQISWALSYRYFDAGFHNFYGSSLSESSGNRNESGLYTGLLLYPLPKIKVSGYIDLYSFPFLTYSTMFPGGGSDILAQVDVTWSKKFSFYLKVKYESKPQKGAAGAGVAADYDESTTKFRIHTEYVVSRNLTFRSRFEFSGYSFNKQNERGFLLFHDLCFSPVTKLNMWLRVVWFNTDGYNSRIYTYENDLLYSFSIPEFHGNGQRFYLNLKWAPSSRITAYMKAGCTIHNGVSSWGSGNDVTTGNMRLELRGLLYLRF